MERKCPVAGRLRKAGVADKGRANRHPVPVDGPVLSTLALSVLMAALAGCLLFALWLLFALARLPLLFALRLLFALARLLTGLLARLALFLLRTVLIAHWNLHG